MTQDMSNKITKHITNDLPAPISSATKSVFVGNESGLRRPLSPSSSMLTLLLFLMMVVGVSEAWGQQMTDFEGVWYIASNGSAYQAGTNTDLPYTYNSTTPATNFYLRPAADPQIDDKTDAFFDGTGQTKPFLTSNYTGHTDIALWILKKTVISYTTSSGDDYYYTIQHVETGKYVVCDPYFATAGTLGENNNSRRKTMHLETKSWDDTIPDKALFKIRYTKDESTATDNFDSYCFIPKVVENKSYKYLNLADRNQPVNYGTKSSQYYGGLAGLYTFKNNNIVDDNSRFKFEQYEVAQPTIMFNNATNEVTITSSVAGAKIYYTTNDDTPTSELTAYSSPVTFTQTTPCSIKAIAVKSWNSGVEVSSEENSYNLQKVAQPTITINADNSVTIACATEDATIYYKTGGDDPTTENATQGISIASILPSQGPIKAFAIKDGCIHSDIATESSIPAKTITVSSSNGALTSEDPIVYDGTAHEPVFTITDGETTINSGEYTSAYSDNTNAGTATITITDKASGDYDISGSFTFTIAQKALTITAKDKEITYGDEPANDGVTYNGFIEGEGENTDGLFTGTLSYAYSYAQYGDVGDAYTITPSGLTATNYDITFVAGTLTVNKREVGIEWGNTSLGYNGSEQVPTATATNVVNNDEIIVTVTGAQTNVGTDYTATATGITGAKAENYQFPSSNPTTTFSIGPGTFTPIVSIEGWTYGETSNAPSVSGNTSGGDVTYSYSVKGEDNYSSDVPTNAGDYTVKVTIAAKGNYESAVATKDFTISPKSIGDGTDVATGFDIKMTQVEDDVEVTYVKDGEKTLVEDKDDTVDIQVQGDDNHVIVTGIGNYGGSVQGLFVKAVFKDTDGNGTDKAAAVYQASSDLANPDGITPYIVRKVNPSIGTMTITPVTYIPKDVPVLMLRTSETTGFLASPKEEATPAITDGTKNSNLLKVAPKDGVKVEAAQIYTFYMGEFVLTKKGTLSEGKFYIYNPNYTATPTEEDEQEQQGGGNAPSLSILRFVIEDEPTGIFNIKDEALKIKNDDSWFSLDGRKLSGKPTKAGLYIKNGHKTVIKRK